MLNTVAIVTGASQIPEGSRHRAVWRAERNRRVDGLPRFSRREMDDALHAPHGRGRGEVDLSHIIACSRRFGCLVDGDGQPRAIPQVIFRLLRKAEP